MKSWIGFVVFAVSLLGLSACAPSDADGCRCAGTVSGVSISAACGGTFCAADTEYRCDPGNAAVPLGPCGSPPPTCNNRLDMVCPEGCEADPDCFAPMPSCDDSCIYANDTECDEPGLCAPGTDCTDCTGMMPSGCGEVGEGEGRCVGPDIEACLMGELRIIACTPPTTCGIDEDGFLGCLGETCPRMCAGRQCGPDGCGGTCGLGCDAGESCNASGICITDVCVARCAAGAECGSDGCHGTCGPGCAAGESCSDGVCVGCVTTCGGRECGPDGCGGTCGPGCAAGQTCSAGVCSGGGSCGSGGACAGGATCSESSGGGQFCSCASGGFTYSFDGSGLDFSGQLRSMQVRFRQIYDNDTRPVSYSSHSFRTEPLHSWAIANACHREVEVVRTYSFVIGGRTETCEIGPELYAGRTSFVIPNPTSAGTGCSAPRL